MLLTHSTTVVKKQWSLSEWLHQILEAELAGWDDDLEPDDYDESNSPMPGGDADYPYDDIDSEILESLLILALAGLFAFLIYYRQQRARRLEEERRLEQRDLDQLQAIEQVRRQNELGLQALEQRPDNLHPPQQQQDQQQEQQQDRGMFPHRNDPEFMDWAAGGIGH
jgi:SEL1 protein